MRLLWLLVPQLLVSCSSTTGEPAREAAQGPRPLSSPPFLGEAEVVTAIDHDRRKDASAGGHADTPVIDQAPSWEWLLPRDTPVLAPGAGRIAEVTDAEPYRCGGPAPSESGVQTVVRLQLDPPHDAWQVGLGIAHPTVKAGQLVAAGDVLGSTGRPTCGSNLELIVWEVKTKTTVDPFGWHIDEPDPFVETAGFATADLFGLSDQEVARLLAR